MRVWCEVDTESALRGKTVGLYFSAHWCPPCRGFTPQLAKSYTSALKDKGLEIVFVSGDQGLDAFSSYYGEMPWLALPFPQSDNCSREKAAALNSKFEVQGIPSLVLLSNDGTKITSDGRNMVSIDPTGEAFPWAGASPGPSGTGRIVPKGLTMQFAEKQANYYKALGAVIEKSTLLAAVPGLLELIIGVHFALSPCGMSILVKWLLVDGLAGCIMSSVGFLATKKSFDAMGDPDLQAYLIRKQRDGTVDEEMEAKTDQNEAVKKRIQPLSSVVYGLLGLGIYLYATSSDEGCNQQPSYAVFHLLILRILWPCVIGCCSAPAVIMATLNQQ